MSPPASRPLQKMSSPQSSLKTATKSESKPKPAFLQKKSNVPMHAKQTILKPSVPATPVRYAKGPPLDGSIGFISRKKPAP